ncbi:hypothetical protein AVEN_135428-1 [Araneus ventricosus]|uniref:Uncharacterized protein n=1 Tax=Araneus ventricosus TaxID=182803 RepID=A0A4Y2BDC7_ARAVE|nr:hypothetical protein AVEN_135428-1 [Araneus ventricosus]
MEVGEEGRERCKCYCLEGESPSIRSLGTKALSGITSFLGLLAIGPTSESVNPCRTRKQPKEVCSANKIRGNRRKPRQMFHGKKRRTPNPKITEVNENRGITYDVYEFLKFI